MKTIEDGILNISGNVKLVEYLISKGKELNIRESIVKDIGRRPENVQFLEFRNGQCDTWCSGFLNGEGLNIMESHINNGRILIEGEDFLSRFFVPNSLFEL